MARNGRTKVIYKGTFISKQTLPVADGATATSQSQDEHGLTFEEFPPTETTSDF